MEQTNGASKQKEEGKETLRQLKGSLLVTSLLRRAVNWQHPQDFHISGRAAAHH